MSCPLLRYFKVLSQQWTERWKESRRARIRMSVPHTHETVLIYQPQIPVSIRYVNFILLYVFGSNCDMNEECSFGDRAG